VLELPQTWQKQMAELIGEVRSHLDQQRRAYAEQVQRIERDLEELAKQQRQLEETIDHHLQGLEKLSPPPAPRPTLDEVLSAVGNLMTATLPEQVLDVLAEEAEMMGVRAAVFDVRGKAAWGASARGFGAELSSKAFHGLVVPLSGDNPFRQVYETGAFLEVTVEQLKRNRNLVEKFRPDPHEPILLLPIRSAGSVSAIFYADGGGKGRPLPTDALRILAEFAGAQLDRLMALSGGSPVEVTEEVEEEAAAVSVTEEAYPAEETVPTPQTVEEEPTVASTVAPEAVPAGSRAASSPAPVAVPAAPPVVPPGPQDLSQLSEAEQKIHRDARRFARLLVSEIELYNKQKVAEGRKNKDLYRRLKADFDRSRQTYDKRFGKTVASQFDYFHDEVVRTLVGNDPSLLGPDYPGPSS